MFGTVGFSSMDNSGKVSTSEESFGNVFELTSDDSYSGGLYRSPSSYLSNQTFSPFAMSPIQTSFSPLDGSNFSHIYDADTPSCYMPGTLLTNEDNLMFQDLENQFPYPIVEGKDKEGKSVIPRPLQQSLSEKMFRAMRLFKEWSGGSLLAQVWAPVRNGDGYVLSTSEQPYILDETLFGYREVSKLFTFAAESRPGSFPGLPGRVFTSNIPEWTSNVVYYNEDEFLRVRYAAANQVCGSIALPVFEDNLVKRSCCAVIELVTTKEKPNFDSEMENLCHALQVSFCSLCFTFYCFLENLKCFFRPLCSYLLSARTCAYC